LYYESHVIQGLEQPWATLVFYLQSLPVHVYNSDTIAARAMNHGLYSENHHFVFPVGLMKVDECAWLKGHRKAIA
jgi:hypothetical protein